MPRWSLLLGGGILSLGVLVWVTQERLDPAPLPPAGPTDTLVAKGKPIEGDNTPALSERWLQLPSGKRVAVEALPESQVAALCSLFQAYEAVREEARQKQRPFGTDYPSTESLVQQADYARGALRNYRLRYALADANVDDMRAEEVLNTWVEKETEEAPECLEVPAALQFTRQVEVLEGGLVAVDMWVAPAVEAEETVVGATLSQRFPGGWEMVEAEPGASVYSPKEHVVKWLVQSAVTTPVNIRFVVRPTSEQAKAQDWQMLPAWVLFRQAGEERRLLVGGAAL